MNKVLINFQEDQFNNDMTLFNSKEAARLDVLEAVKELTNCKDFNSTFTNETIENTYKLIEDQYRSRNQLKLSGKKLVEVLEIDMSEIIKANDKYQSLLDVKKPMKKNYCSYAETEEEIIRLNAAKKVIDSINELSKHTKVFNGTIVGAVNGAVTCTLRNQNLIPNLAFVKSV